MDRICSYTMILCIVSLTTLPRPLSGSKQTEYCVFETFTAECEDNQIIVVNEAKYGRMRKSRCITKDEIGCYVDALPFIDKVCSGRTSCEFIPVIVKDLYKTLKSKCSADLESFLEVTYDCIEVSKSDLRACANSNGVILDKPESYISNELFTQSQQSALQCPVTIKALPGQTINVKLINFTPAESASNCHKFGYLAEPGVKYNESVCLSPKRQRHIYTSSGHSIQMLINTQQLEQIQSRFLIHYIVEGCANLVAPEYAWSKRVDNTVKVGCLHKNMTWHLTCQDNRWLGVVGSCNSSKDSLESLPTPSDQPYDFNGLSLKTIIIIAIGILLIILVCMAAICVKCLCCNGQNRNNNSGPHLNENSLDRNYGYASNKRSSWLYTFKHEKQKGKHIWESPLPTPKVQHDRDPENISLPGLIDRKQLQQAPKASQECLSECGEYMAPVKLREKHITKSMDSLPQRERPEGDEYTSPVSKDPEEGKGTIENEAEYTVPENIRNINVQKDPDVKYTPPSNLRFPTDVNDIFPPPPTEEELGDLNDTDQVNDNALQESKGLHCGPHGTVLGHERVGQLTAKSPRADTNDDDDEYMLPANMR